MAYNIDVIKQIKANMNISLKEAKQIYDSIAIEVNQKPFRESLILALASNPEMVISHRDDDVNAAFLLMQADAIIKEMEKE